VKKPFLSALVIGLLLGAGTSFGQTYIPGPLMQFANSYSVWLLVSYLFGMYGASSVRSALGGGVIVQLMALVGYYLTSELRFSSGFGSISILLMWITGGIVGGSLLAYGAYLGLNNYRIRLLAVGVMTLVILSEAAYIFIVLRYIDEGFCFVGLAIVFVASRYVQSSHINRLLGLVRKN
jgi:MFS family permease